VAELKKEAANQYYSQKQYKKALVGYNEVIGECANTSIFICCYISVFICYKTGFGLTC